MGVFGPVETGVGVGVGSGDGEGSGVGLPKTRFTSSSVHKEGVGVALGVGVETGKCCQSSTIDCSEIFAHNAEYAPPPLGRKPYSLVPYSN